MSQEMEIPGFTQADRKVLILLEDGLRRMEAEMKPNAERMMRLEIEKASRAELQGILETISTKVEEDDFDTFRREVKAEQEKSAGITRNIQLQLATAVGLITGGWFVLKFVFKV